MTRKVQLEKYLMKMTMPINTKRVLIREYQESDFEIYYSLLSDYDVNKYLGSWVPKTKDFSYLDFKETLAQQTEILRTRYFFAVELNSTRELIGNVGLTIVEDRIADIGWIFRKAYWGFGYATEATILLINYTFVNNIADKLTASHKHENIKSEKIMNKIGFMLDRKDADRAYYFLSKKDWVRI